MLLAKTTVIVGTFAALCGAAWGQADDVADVPAQERRAGDDENRRYFLIGPPAGVKPPKEGYGLVIVLPGGDGSAEFHAFVKRIYKHAVPEGYVVAQPIAVEWRSGQKTVWPTALSRVPGQKFTTEEFIRSVVVDVKAAHKIDARKVFLLTWSSSGPAAYTESVSEGTPVAGSFIAMSVFRPELLGKSPALKGRRYYLYHSPEDRVCPFRMAQTAHEFLKSKGAEVQMATYRGGHGWRSPTLYADIRRGLEWLDRSASTQPAASVSTQPAGSGAIN